MLYGALAVWALPWALPSLAVDDGTLYGWHCFLYAMAFRFLMDEPLGRTLIESASPWTNFLVPIAVLTLERRRESWLRRRLAPLLFVSWALNLVWIWPMRVDPHVRLLPGYYLWMVSFLLLALAVPALLRREDPSALSAPDGSAPPSKALRAGAIIALLVLGALAGFGLLAGPPRHP